jgi:hypothetical protein
MSFIANLLAYTITLILLSCFSANGQESFLHCATDLNLENIQNKSNNTDTNYLIEQWILQQQTGPKSRNLEKYHIPVVVHIVYQSSEQNLSDDRVLQQIERLNIDFNLLNADISKANDLAKSLSASTGFEFCLAETDPQGNPTNGITRTQTDFTLVGIRTTEEGRTRVFYDEHGGVDAWDQSKYLNIYVCDLGGIGGYSSKPGVFPFPEEDGIAVNFRFFGINNSTRYPMGRITVHEVGHYFNLDHLWGLEPGCEFDDYVHDTPRQFGPYLGCPGAGQISCDSKDLVNNFMDYVNDTCMYMFTRGQVLRMQASLALFRPELILNNTCNNAPSPGRLPALTVYPNPAAQGPIIARFNLTGKSPERWLLTDISGKIIKSTDRNGLNLWAVEISDLPTGIYILHVIQEGRNYSAKIVKTE